MRHGDRHLRGAFHAGTKRSGGGGCLALVILLPALAVTALGLVVAGLFGGSRRASGGRMGRARRDPVLESLVAKLALDDTFSQEDAETAGVPLDETRSVAELLQEGVECGWIERHGDRFAVTAAGRERLSARR